MFCPSTPLICRDLPWSAEDLNCFVVLSCRETSATCPPERNSGNVWTASRSNGIWTIYIRSCSYLEKPSQQEKWVEKSITGYPLKYPRAFDLRFPVLKLRTGAPFFFLFFVNLKRRRRQVIDRGNIFWLTVTLIFSPISRCKSLPGLMRGEFLLGEK